MPDTLCSCNQRLDSGRQETASSPATILLVDDDPMIRSLLGAVLQQAGFAVVASPDGSQALEMFKSDSSIDVLVTDFEMPGMNGFALASKLTEARGRLPVLIISGAEQGILPIAEMRNRGWLFMEKPLRSDTLLSNLSRLMGKAKSGVLRSTVGQHPASSALPSRQIHGAR